VFEEAHQELIDTTLDPESKAYHLAQQALNNSVSWIIQLVGYMEDTYKDLIRQNTFTIDKAWQLVTQLARRILLEVSRPRIGVNNSFKVGDNDQIGRLVLWPVLKCQDIMRRYKEAGFKDDPTIASEYVKFLAANSGTDAVDKMTSRVNALEIEVKDASKVAKNSGTSASTASNKVDEVKKTLADLLKRVAKVEGKA
jgi:hypothetical protein